MQTIKRVPVIALPTVVWACAAIADGAGEDRKQLHHLPAAETPRFEVTDRVWPEKPGDAHVCLWKDDKLCALSITIDDNCAPDHPWWIEQGKKYGWHFTWFVITGRADTGGYWGTWEGWREMRRLGHDVQSHTVTHLHFKDEGQAEDDIKDIDDEYAISVRHIEENLKDHRCMALAYPGGKNSQLNERDIAARYFIGARGVVGHINKANQIDYLDTSSVGGINIGGAPWSEFNNLLDPALYRGRGYRGWYCTHFHGVKEDRRRELGEKFEYIKQREDQVWVGLFREVVMYGQQRDTARLKTLDSKSQEIRFNLSDDMDDTLFDFPLTVKVHLPDNWRTVRATQAGAPVEVSRLEQDGSRFALIQVIPDRGDITLTDRVK